MKDYFEELYVRNSKHSHYQILSSNLKHLINEEELMIHSRFEKERLQYISEKLNLRDKTVLDIGGNTGFFTFEAANLGAKKVFYYEGNRVHAEFVGKATEMLQLNERIEVFPEYYLFEQKETIYDITFLLNVIHHLGDDFGGSISMEKAKEKMLSYINYMSEISKVMIFQMGYNWCGNIRNCLFKTGTKKEMGEFLQEGTLNNWEIINVGIAVKRKNKIIYEDINDSNNHRDDSLGEFLNRPIFIMKSKKLEVV